MKSLGKWRFLLAGLLLALLTATGLAQGREPLVINLADADMTLVGEDIADWAAYFASPAGDVNGDGLGDALIGAPMAGNKVCPYPIEPCPPPYIPKGEGVGYLVLGRPKGDWLPNPVNLADADASFLGCETNSMTARQLYTAGDVNGDGYDDILVSGWKCGSNYTGKAYLFLGRPDVSYWGSQFPVEQADASFLGEHEWDFLSYYVATAGDVNADGYDDILITSTHYDIGDGAAIANAGKVYLILGRAAADWGADYPVAQADASFLGEAEEDRIGRSATGVGDVNGDGYGDFLIGSISSDYGGEDAGQNYLFLGRPSPGQRGSVSSRPWWGTNYSVAGADASFIGEAAGDESGRRVAAAGDVNGDGYDDMLIGAALNDQAAADAGIGYLVLGRQAADWGLHYPLANANASFTGEDRRDQAGRRLTGAGDVNNDGYDDILIGAPHNSRGGDFAGAAYLIHGRPAADWGTYFPLAQADVIYVGKPEVGVAGYDVAELGDFDGDSIDDILVAAFGGRNNNTVPGEAYILLGGEAPRPVDFLPDSPAGHIREWHSFTGTYWDPNGQADLTQVQLVLGRTTGDDKGLNVRYDPGANTLYLHQAIGAGWIGPCTPGADVRLSNGIVDLDCAGSTVSISEPGLLRVTWRARWMEPLAAPLEFTAYLRAIDQADHDSGFVALGAWTVRDELLRITKKANRERYMSPGEPITYTLAYRNEGVLLADNVVITDPVPDELINVSFTSDRPITPIGPIPYTWQVGDLMPTQGGMITLTGVIRPDLPPGHVFTNTATISSNTPDGDPADNTSSARVSIQAAPVAVDDSYTAYENERLRIFAPGVMANDYDINGDKLKSILDQPPQRGTLQLKLDGSFQYDPSPDFHGVDTFTYHVTDSTEDSNVATVTLTVLEQNDPPLAVKDHYTTDEDVPLVVDPPGVLGNDTDPQNDPLEAALDTWPLYGTVKLQRDGSFTYTPKHHFFGVDEFTYFASDGIDDSEPVSVAITVRPVDDPPVAVADSYVVFMNEPLVRPAPGVLANDVEVDGDLLIAVLGQPPTVGTLLLNLDGSFTYTPPADWIGVTTFTYHAYDGRTNSNTVTVTLNVQERSVFDVYLPFVIR